MIIPNPATYYYISRYRFFLSTLITNSVTWYISFIIEKKLLTSWKQARNVYNLDWGKYYDFLWVNYKVGPMSDFCIANKFYDVHYFKSLTVILFFFGIYKAHELGHFSNPTAKFRRLYHHIYFLWDTFSMHTSFQFL